MSALPSRFLVTGGAGFIGSHLVARLARRPGARVWVLDNLHPQAHGPDARAPVFPRNVHFARADIRDAGALAAVVAEARPEAVFHFAAETGTGQSYDEPGRYCDVNVLGTARLVEALRAPACAGLRRVVLASSRAVYGEGLCADHRGERVVPPPRRNENLAAGRFDPEDAEGRPLAALPTPEDATPRPGSVYAATKLMQEQLLQHCSAAAAWGAAILRLQNVYGPGQSINNPYTGVLSIFARQILEGRTLEVYEDGRILRDFVFVDDVVEAFLACLERPLAPGETINIGSGSAISILAAAQALLGVFGQPADRYRISGRYRAGDVRAAVADIGRAQARLGWSPRTPFAEGLPRLAAWCRERLSCTV